MSIGCLLPQRLDLAREAIDDRTRLCEITRRRGETGRGAEVHLDHPGPKVAVGTPR